jgi:hypothetical protein
MTLLVVDESLVPLVRPSSESTGTCRESATGVMSRSRCLWKRESGCSYLLCAPTKEKLSRLTSSECAQPPSITTRLSPDLPKIQRRR